MAVRPLALGARFIDKGRQVRLTPISKSSKNSSPKDPTRYAVTVRRDRGDEWTHQHPTLAAAVQEFASAWRARLH